VSQTQIIRKEFDVEKESKHYKYMLEAVVDEHYVHRMRLVRRWSIFPMYEKYVDNVLEISEMNNARQIGIKSYQVGVNRNRSERDENGEIIIDIGVFQETPDFMYRDTIEQITSAEDFEDLIENIKNFVIDYVNFMI
jgi:hypothetical protein